MKIGIITMSNSVNYGNKLQNYAVQKVLEELGAEVETIKNYTNQRIKNTRDFKEIIKSIITNVYSRILYIENEKLNHMLREKRFDKFTIKFIKQSDFIITKNQIKFGIENMYDYFVCGSDQIWNPNFDINSEIDFLTFAKSGQKIAYAPSFGVENIPDKHIEKYKEWIGQIDYLSVREKAGADIIKELTGREAKVLLDPTMMLSKEQWLNIAIKPKIKIQHKYILTYFLGEKDNNSINYINNISKKYGFKIINLLDITNKNIYSIDPRELLWLINNCEILFTDSFHGCVFSIIMKKIFVVFNRNDNLESMNSRLDTLLLKFNMTDRLYKNIKNNRDIFNINFDHVDDILKIEKEKSVSYLKEALQLNGFNNKK